jgi:hypothetical protein
MSLSYKAMVMGVTVFYYATVTPIAIVKHWRIIFSPP